MNWLDTDLGFACFLLLLAGVCVVLIRANKGGWR